MAARMVLRTNSAPNLAALAGPADSSDEIDPPPDYEQPEPPVEPDEPVLVDVEKSENSEFRLPIEEKSELKRSASANSLDDLLEVIDLASPLDLAKSPSLSSLGASEGDKEDEESSSKAESKADSLSGHSELSFGLGRMLKRPGFSSSSLNLEAMLNKTLPVSYVRRINEMFSKAAREEPLPLFRDIIEGKVLTVKQVQALNRLSLLTISPPIAPVVPPRKEVKQVLNIQIASDLHIEMFSRNKLKPKLELYKEVIKPAAPYLALLGDIGCPGTEEGFLEYERFLLCHAKHFKKVLILAGNHEYYNPGFEDEVLTVNQIKQRIQKLCDSQKNMIFLDKKSVVLDGVRIIGCTLWSQIPRGAKNVVEKGLNDYHLVYLEEGEDPKESKSPLKSPGGGVAADFFGALPRFSQGKPVRTLRMEDTVRWHKEELAFIAAEAAEAKRLGQRALVLSHHTPTFNGTSNPVYKASPLRWAFSTNLEHMFAFGADSPFSAIHTWASGHTHWSCDQMINGVHVVSNQYGYTGTAECTYKPAFVLTI